MGTIKVSPEKMKAGANKIEKNLNEFEKDYKQLTSLISRNEAAFDQATLTAIKQSVEKMDKQYKDMVSYLGKVVTVSKNVASEYEKANEAAGKRISAITI